MGTCFILCAAEVQRQIFTIAAFVLFILFALVWRVLCPDNADLSVSVTARRAMCEVRRVLLTPLVHTFAK